MDLFVAGRDQSAADQPNYLAEGHPPAHCNHCNHFPSWYSVRPLWLGFQGFLCLLVREFYQRGAIGNNSKCSFFALRSQPFTAPSANWHHLCFTWKLQYKLHEGLISFKVNVCANWQGGLTLTWVSTQTLFGGFLLENNTCSAVSLSTSLFHFISFAIIFVDYKNSTSPIIMWFGAVGCQIQHMGAWKVGFMPQLI